MSCGALILGHASANIVSVATKQIACGSSFGITNMYENQLATEIIMDSLYVKNLGYMIHPDIQHLYSDDLWMYIGKQMNNIHYLDDVIIEHEHYSCGKSLEDDLYRELNCSERFHNDENAYKNVINSIEFNNQIRQLISDKLNYLHP
jgi:hypothetical protein